MLKEEVLRLLREDAAFREEVRRQVLTDDLLALREKRERRFETPTGRVDSTIQQIDKLAAEIDALIQRIRRAEERWGLSIEPIAQDFLPEILQRKGWKVLRATLLVFDRETWLVVAVEVEGRVFTLAAEVKGRVRGRTTIDQVLAKARQPAFVAAVHREGFPEPIVPVVFGLVIYSGAAEAARETGVGLFSPHGELVAPALRP